MTSGQGSDGAFQLNLSIPEPSPPRRDAAQEARVRDFLGHWGPAVPADAGDGATLPDFGAQCEALLDAAPRIVSSVMGLFPPDFIAEIKARGIVWFANISTVAEARAAAAAGADVVGCPGDGGGRASRLFRRRQRGGADGRPVRPAPRRS